MTYWETIAACVLLYIAWPLLAYIPAIILAAIASGFWTIRRLFRA